MSKDGEDHRYAAEDVGVGGGEEAQGKQRGGAHTATHRQNHSPNEDARRAPEEDLHVLHERLEEAGKGLGENVAVEERTLDLVPARGLGNEGHQQTDDDQRRGDERSMSNAASGAARIGAGPRDWTLVGGTSRTRTVPGRSLVPGTVSFMVRG